MSQFLNDITAKMTVKRYAPQTITAYIAWIKKYILYHHKQHPENLSREHIEDFLSSLADQHVSKSTQQQAFFALRFLYKEFLGLPFDGINAKRASKLPQSRFALTQADVLRLLDATTGIDHLILLLIYGCGLRVSECVNLRVKDVQDETLIIRQSKHNTDRCVPMPQVLIAPMQDHLAYVKTCYESERRDDRTVPLPRALARKYPNAPKEWAWFWVFPGKAHGQTRNALTVNGIQKMLKKAAQRAGLIAPVTPHILRHTFATHYLQMGGRLKDLKELLGHKSLETTLGYVHVMDLQSVVSPLDTLPSK